jgi:hypothetical protein
MTRSLEAIYRECIDGLRGSGLTKEKVIHLAQNADGGAVVVKKGTALIKAYPHR